MNTVDAGTGAYHLGLSGSGTTLYTMWNGPGSGGSTAIAATVLSGGGLAVAGTPYTVSCAVGTSCVTDVRGVVFDPVNGKFYYSTAADGASGTFGTVVFNDVTHTATLTQLLSGVFAHGVSFDPFTKEIIMNSAGTIEQFDPVSGTIVSTLTGIGNFDQAAEDGKGHLFVASNSGFLEFVDYDATVLGRRIRRHASAGAEFAYFDGFGITRPSRSGKTPTVPFAQLGLVAKDQNLLTWKSASPRA